MKAPPIYVETRINSTVERLWQLKQDPALHQRWDLRFSEITYMPRASAEEPQRFLYETRIGFGLGIRGTGESTGQIARGGGETTSALKFASADPKSLIREGSGYWRYLPRENGIRFLTWYDYDVRFGTAGRVVDRLLFRPLIGWATAWSFDRLRMWAEDEQSPEASRDLALLHAISRLTVAAVWLWHGLVPKLLFRSADELTMLREAGFSAQWLPRIGIAEVLFGILILFTWRSRTVLVINALLMILATLSVALWSPEYLTAAFNPVSLNVSVLALSIVGWIAAGRIPTAIRCLRKKPAEDA
jgi:uncharacterized membrane protein YphA (DoxX/SURF4 family)